MKGHELLPGMAYSAYTEYDTLLSLLLCTLVTKDCPATSILKVFATSVSRLEKSINTLYFGNHPVSHDVAQNVDPAHNMYDRVCVDGYRRYELLGRKSSSIQLWKQTILYPTKLDIPMKVQCQPDSQQQ